MSEPTLEQNVFTCPKCGPSFFVLFWIPFFKHVGEGWVHASFRDYAEKRCAEPVLYAIIFLNFPSSDFSRIRGFHIPNIFAWSPPLDATRFCGFIP